jgi:hypothetical protein
MSDSDRDRDLFWSLARRYNELGRLLPSVDDLDPDDLEAVTSAHVVLLEMDRVEAEFRTVLARNAPTPPKRRAAR